MSDYAELEALLRGLLTGEHTSLVVSFNDGHACNYVDARTFYDRGGNEDLDTGWVSPEEREKALETNSVWECHWFPRTPVVSCSLKASTLGALLEALEALKL